MSEAVSDRRSFHWLLVIFLAALALRAGYVLTLDQEIQWNDGREYYRLARSISENRTYSNNDGSPTALWPPGYPVFLALSGGSTTITRIIQAIIGAVSVLLAYAIAGRFMGYSKALLAAGSVAIYPLYIHAAGVFYPVVILTLLMGGIVFLLLRALDEGSGKKSLLAGVLGGLMTVTKASSLLALGFVILWLLWENQRSKHIRTGMRLSVLFIVPIVLLAGAWSVRNYRALGTPVLVSTNGGYNFWIGNFPGTKATTGNREVPGREEEEGKIRSLHHGEVELDRVFYQRGFEYIKKEPWRFIRLSLCKAFNLWRLYPDPLTRDIKRWEIMACVMSYGILMLFALYWLVMNARKRSVARLILLIFLAYTIVHALYISKVRFRLPLDMLIAVAAAGGIGDLAKRLGIRILEQEQ